MWYIWLSVFMIFSTHTPNIIAMLFPEESSHQILKITIHNNLEHEVNLVPILVYCCTVKIQDEDQEIIYPGTFEIKQEPITIGPSRQIAYTPPSSEISGFTKDHLYQVSFQRNSRTPSLQLLSLRFNNQKTVIITKSSTPKNTYKSGQP